MRGVVGGGGGVLRQPGVGQHVLRRQSLRGLLAQQAADEALGARGQTVGQGEVAATDLGEKTGVLLAVEGIPGTDLEKMSLGGMHTAHDFFFNTRAFVLST
jgi:hypothetical protein